MIEAKSGSILLYNRPDAYLGRHRKSRNELLSVRPEKHFSAPVCVHIPQGLEPYLRNAYLAGNALVPIVMGQYDERISLFNARLLSPPGVALRHPYFRVGIAVPNLRKKTVLQAPGKEPRGQILVSDYMGGQNFYTGHSGFVRKFENNSEVRFLGTLADTKSSRTSWPLMTILGHSRQYPEQFARNNEVLEEIVASATGRRPDSFSDNDVFWWELAA